MRLTPIAYWRYPWIMRNLAGLVLFLAACSSNPANPAGGGGAGGDGGFIPTDGGVTVMADKVVITMDPFPVGAGQEVYMCQDFANPFSGMDAEISGFESHMSAGSHHMLLLYKDNAIAGTATPCSGLTFGPMPYGSQRPDNAIQYPSGIAALIKGTQGFTVDAHYLNATQNDIMAQVQVILYKAQPGTVTQHAGVFFLNNVSALYPPAGGIPMGQMKTITASYTTKAPLNILYATGHTHRFTTSFSASFGSTMYSTDSWDNAPNAAYQPAVALPTGTTITWSCTIDNTMGTSELTFGESAQTNEMCIFNGQYYPVANDASPTISVTR
jgi:hypothetical protein